MCTPRAPGLTHSPCVQALAKRERLLFIETSAKDASNVDAAFKQVLLQLANGVTNRGTLGGGGLQPQQEASGPTPSTQVSRIDLQKGKKAKRGSCCSS